VAPPHYPPGSNPQPGVEITQVRMVAETVVIEVLRDLDPKSLGNAHVTADFTMRNLGTSNESMAARFPIANDDGFGRYPELHNLQIKVNGKPVQYRRTNYPDLYYPTLANVPWAEFDIVFPVGKDVPIQVTYDLDGSGYYPWTVFYYVLNTGAGWKDTIGSADIILRLPYDANLQNVVTAQTGWGSTTPGGSFAGKEVRWHFEDFEPGDGQPVQNMEFALVAPSTWQAVLSAQENVAKHPNDGEAWGMLGKAYKAVAQLDRGPREDAGGQEAYKQAVEAYEKCLMLKPDDAQWHAGFADLLARHSMWDVMSGESTPEAVRALEEIHTALELAPDDPVVQNIAREMTHLLYGGIILNGEEFDFPWLTQTPTAIPAWTPTTSTVEESTPTKPSAPPTETNVPEFAAISTRPAPAATPAASPQRSLPFCGSAVLLLVAVWFAWKLR
jgi:hypothetical protein